MPDASPVSWTAVFAMNRGCAISFLEPSRTFYGKRQNFDPHPVLTEPLTLLSAIVRQLSSRVPSPCVCEAMVRNSRDNLYPNQGLKHPKQGVLGIIAGSLNRIFDGWVVHCFHVFIGSGNVQSEQCIAVAVCSQPAASHGLL